MLLIVLSASLLLLVDGRATSNKPCLAKCPADHHCEWKTLSDSECYNPPCGQQPSCVPNVPTLSCANVLCNVGYKCQESPTGPKCVEAERCATTGCPNGFKCDTSVFEPGTCIPVITCASTTCHPDSICQDLPNEDATCVPVDPITCATILCAPGHMCVDGPSGSKCIPFTTCKTSTCPRGKKCVDNPGSSATCKPVVTCASTSCPFGSTCIDFPNQDAKCQTSNTYGNTKKCTAKCTYGQKCVFRPTPDSQCYNLPCADVPTCVSALSDDETSCDQKECYAGYKCAVQLGIARCVLHRTCEELNCPSGQRCEDVLDNARCVPIRTCQTLRCPSEQICSEPNGQNAVCRPIQTCATLLCNSKQVCRAGNGREDAVCVDGVAANPCASTTCLSGQSCQTINGKAQCVPNGDVSTPSPVICNCRAGEKCVSRAVVCVRAPCLPVLECKRVRDCSPNEVYSDCSNCEKTCSNPNPICTNQCNQARCVCRNGFVRDYSGVCVPANACSRQPDAGVAYHLNNCELLRCPIASSCYDYGDRAECLYGALRDDIRTISTGGPVRATISPIRFTGSPKLSCQTVKCTADHQCVETSQGPQCQEIRFTIGPITPGRYLADSTRVTISPIRALQSCAAVSCPVGHSCLETKKGPVCEPAYYTIGPVTPKYQLYDNIRATVSPIKPSGCLTVKCSAGYHCAETPTGGVCQPDNVKGSCSTILLNCIAGNACKDTPDGPRCLPVDTVGCNCAKNQKCVATPVTCITTPCNPVLSCQPLTQCGVNEAWRDCSGCDALCDKPDLVCAAVCGPPKCQCKNGYARDQTGMCIPKNKCTKQYIGVKPATYCQYLRTKCTGACYDYTDRAECIPSNQAVYSDFLPTFNCSHVNCPDQLGCLDTPRGPLCVVLQCDGVTCPSDLLCRETRDGPKCVPPFIYTDTGTGGIRHGYGGFPNKYAPPSGATCELVDCVSGHRCIETPTGPMCIPMANPPNSPVSPKATCELVDCRSGQRCMDAAAGPICIPGVGGSSTASCATTDCAADTRCQDTVIGPLCVPLSGSNNTYNININCVCGAGEECVIIQQSCPMPPCTPKSECRKKTGVPSVKPSITCANVRCAGPCVDTPTGPSCTTQPTIATCASTSCLVGYKCVESPTGARCEAPYGGGNSEVCEKANEELNGCGNHCEGSCEFVGENRVCTADCRPPACACKTGFYRNSQGECVPASECPIKEPVCVKPNEEVGQCGNHCEGSCDFVDEPRICTADCRPPACACKSGFYRNAIGDCVTANQCPPKTPECTKQNEILGPCGNLCEQKCKFVNEPQACIEICKPPACMCKNGFYRNDNGECVSAGECSTQNGYGDEPPSDNNNNSYNLSCPSTERVNPCGDLCEAKCEHIGKGPVACVKICNPPACVCKDGFFRNKKGVCVAPNSCPSSSTYMGGKGGDGRIPYRH